MNSPKFSYHFKCHLNSEWPNCVPMVNVMLKILDPVLGAPIPQLSWHISLHTCTHKFLILVWCNYTSCLHIHRILGKASFYWTNHITSSTMNYKRLVREIYHSFFLSSKIFGKIYTVPRTVIFNHFLVVDCKLLSLNLYPLLYSNE